MDQKFIREFEINGENPADFAVDDRAVSHIFRRHLLSIFQHSRACKGNTKTGRIKLLCDKFNINY
jgi:hypothetical protein